MVTMALSCVVSEIFNVQKCRDLEIGVKGHSRSSNESSFDRACMVSFFIYRLLSELNVDVCISVL